MKVLHISGARSWGGNEQQLVDLLPELNKLGVTNLILGIRDSPLHKSLQNQQYKFIFSKAPKIAKQKNFSFLKEIVSQENPDVIHLHTSDSVTLFVISDLLFNLKTPAVLSKKGMGSSMSFLSKYKYNYKNLVKIISVSKAVKKELKEQVIKPKNHDRLEVVYDGVNLERTKVVRHENLRDLFHISKNDLLLGNIANHVRAKDLGVLIRMLDHLVNKLGIRGVHLVQIGEFSALTKELRDLVSSLQLEEYITFAGFQKNAVDFIPQFDIYVMSSQREGFPITIMEAFYKGTPVVSTRAGGIAEAIVDGENGFLAEVGNHIELAEKIVQLKNTPSLEQKFVENSRKYFYENFMASTTAEKTFSLYREIIQS